METKITVTRINSRYHARLYVDNKLFDEMSCELRIDIGFICREMLRWLDKVRGGNKHSAAARKRQTTSAQGRIYYSNKLHKLK